MQIYTGIDIIEVERIKQNIEQHGDVFLNRIFTKNEIEYCESKNLNKYQSYAGRFAVKEAVFKAISKLLTNKYEICWKDIEVINDENGRPVAHILNSNFFNYKIDISISHINIIAVANAVVTVV